MISVVGNTKNAGKTTVINQLLKAIDVSCIGITSIGLDGEEIDQVTFMDKPRIFVRPGYIVATAEETLSAFEAAYEVIFHTDIPTAIGNVIIVSIKSSGNALIAGPSVVSDMAKVIDLMDAYDLMHVFIDGAFFRQSFARVAQATILVIGANQNQSMEQVVKDATLIKRKLTLKKPPFEVDTHQFQGHISFFNSALDFEKMEYTSLIGHTEKIFNETNKEYRFLYLPKAITNEFVNQLVKHRRDYQWDILIESPINIQLSSANLSHLFRLKNRLYVINEINLVAICYNPVSPQGYVFEEIAFKEKLEEMLDVEVINVMRGV